MSKDHIGKNNPNYKHGGKGSRLYMVWHSMKQRILNSKASHYKYYGGRGIIICPEWTESYIKFRDWSLNNGYIEGLEIDRRNTNGNYEPSNCRFVTKTINIRNSRATKLNMEKANEIRCLYKTGDYTQKELSKLFNLNSKSSITFIINNKIWRN